MADEIVVVVQPAAVTEMQVTVSTIGDGVDGLPGVGVPAGGTTGQVLAKASGTDYDTEWGDVAGGTGAVDSVNTQTGVVVLDAADVGADATGTASGLLSTHTAAADPHPGYLTAAEGTAAYDVAGAAATAASAAASALATHEGDTTAVHGIANTANLETTAGAQAKADAAQAAAAQRANHTGTQSADTVVDGSTNHVFTAADDTKLGGIATAATANDTDANLKARANHTGTQAMSTISDAGTAATVNTGTTSGTIPLLSTGGVLPVARLATGTPDGTKYIRDDGTLVTPAGGSSAQSLRDVYLRPSACLAETWPRTLSSSNNSPVSQSLWLAPIALSSGMVIGRIAFGNAFTAAVTPTNWWFGLYDSALLQLATTADQTTTAWGTATVKSLAIAADAAGAAATFTTTYTGLHYLGFMMKAATVVDLAQTVAGGVSIGTLSPRGGASNTGQTTPPAFPFTATAPSGTASPIMPYGYVAA